MPDSQHTPWSDPQTHGLRLRELPADADALPDALENFVIHHAIACSLGFGVPPAAEPPQSNERLRRTIQTVPPWEKASFLTDPGLRGPRARAGET